MASPCPVLPGSTPDPAYLRLVRDWMWGAMAGGGGSGLSHDFHLPGLGMVWAWLSREGQLLLTGHCF